MKKCFTTVFSLLFVVSLLSSCTEISDPVEEINNMVEGTVILDTEGSDGDKGGPKGGS